MGCYVDEETGSVLASLRFKRDELLYDIENCAYIEGHSLGEGDVHLRHGIQDVGDRGNVDRITRVLNLSVARCREMLYPYVRREIDNPDLDNEMQEPGVYGIVLELPTGFSQTTLNLLEELIHEYLVCTSMGEWLSITYPDKAPVWYGKAEEAENEIRSSLMSRIGGLRRKLGPF